MSPNETSRTSGGGGSRLAEALTPGRIGMAVLAIVTLVFIFQNTREVRIRLLVPEVSMPLYLALLATALIGAACGGYAAARRRK
ncbi:lipopolysaccharide assembly protein LapA domain-containing protein [Streptomyces sp. NPDC090301]|uniref:lipopolysaccharide assembly protein LapA domain-containing protein n=1 Tax=Streptomyces sp. NPDC090301 TaxID=3154975 RepID=UPI0034369B61